MNLRSLVALPRKRYETEEKKKLDLAYVTPDLIVCSMPTASYWRSWYRMGALELRDYLDEQHGPHWKVWNLQQKGECDYDDELFYGRVVHHPIEDHTPPTLAQLLEIVDEMVAWCDAHEQNVAVVHCKAGQGRSGTVACAYLQLKHELSHAKALETFSAARMRNWFGQGVRIPSQVRYLAYIEGVNGGLSAGGPFGGPFGPGAGARQTAQSVPGGTTNHTTPDSPAPSTFSSLLPATLSTFAIAKIVLVNPAYTDITVDVLSASLDPNVVRAAHVWDIRMRTNGERSVQIITPVKTLRTPADVGLAFQRTKYVKGVPVLHSVARLYFNAQFEQREGPVFSCSWADLDGVSGFPIKGLALFERVEVHVEEASAKGARAKTAKASKSTRLNFTPSTHESPELPEATHTPTPFAMTGVEAVEEPQEPIDEELSADFSKRPESSKVE